MKRNKKECNICGSLISFSNFNSHSKSCAKKKEQNPSFSKVNNDFVCNFCGKIFSKYGIKAHIWRSHTEKGKNFIPCPKGTLVAWNKGLTKETNETVRKISILVSKNTIGKPGRPQSEETKKRISESRKRFLKLHPELHPNRILAGNRSKWTYPERIASNWFDKNNISFEYNKKIDKFFPDFTIESKKLIIEIDGEQFHKDKSYDKNRDKILSELGYTIIRIDSKENIENRLKQIFSPSGSKVDH
jgi:hypothetical protein